jgi:hypothetical protein
MKLTAGSIPCLVALAALLGHASARPVPTPADHRSRAAEVVAALAGLDAIDPDAVAKALGRKIVETRDVTAYRREHRLAPGPVFADATVVVGGQGGAWRIVVLEAVSDPGLRFAELMPPLLDAPYQARPWIQIHRNPPRSGLEHRCALRAGELVVTETQDHRIERILLTTERTIAPKTPTRDP